MAPDTGNGETDEAGNTENQEGEPDGEKQLEPGFPTGAAGFGAANGAFPNMPFGATGGFDQMQMMMAMQNGMAPNGFGFPMMGRCT